MPGPLGAWGCRLREYPKIRPAFFEKVKTFLASFPHVVVSEHKRSLVLFGCDQKRPPAAEIVQKAAMLQRRHGFEFAFVERAAALKTYRETDIARSRPLRDVAVLNDE